MERDLDGEFSHLRLGRKLVELAKARPPQRIGRRYANIVLACLSEDNLNTDTEVDEVQGRIGIGYMKPRSFELGEVATIIESPVLVSIASHGPLILTKCAVYE